MRITTAATAALLLAALTACGGNDNGEATVEKKPTPAASESVDCTSQTLSQAEWIANCSEEGASTGGDGTEGKLTDLKFGETYTWPDGLKVSVVEAKVFTDYDPELLESAEPGMTDFRLELKLENTGTAPVALDDLSVIVEGATNGGEAASSSFSNGSAPLDGRLAPGVSAVKTDDNVLESKYGTRIVATVQRSSENFDLEFPEFEGEIAD